MQYLTFSETESSTFTVAILVNNLRKADIENAYIKPFGLDPSQVVAIKLHQLHDGNGKGRKTPASEMKRWIQEELKEVLDNCQVQYLLVADGDYFKIFTKKPKVDAFSGYVLPSEYGSWNCITVPTYEQIFYDPGKVRGRIAMALQALKDHAVGRYRDPGIDIIDYVDYPMTVPEIKDWLEVLLKQNNPLSVDIEGFSLKFHKAGIGSITFCWNQREGIAFPVDFLDPVDALEVRDALRDFFIRFQNKTIYHNISFDVTVLIYQLFMKDILDTEGLLYGLEMMLKNWDDTKLITYLATNSCAGNRLGLKEQAQEYAGNYAVEEITDIRKIPLPELLQYNLVDGLSTWFVYEKHYPTLIADNQKDIYENIFKPAIIDIIQMQLTGMPLDMERVKIAKAKMQEDADKALDRINANPLVQAYSYKRLEEYVDLKNAEWKKKRTTIAEMQVLATQNDAVRKATTFNPNSGPQLATLLYERLGLPVIETTDSGQPATGGSEMKALQNHTKDPQILDLLQALVDLKAVDKILTAFIPAMEEAIPGPDGWHYLCGFFNLGGTLSGRLSSSDPNLQNLPANGRYAKLIKWCFRAPPGWHFGGIDFASLEDRISGLTTKDPNKLKVYTDGWDGHAMRAVVYFADQMPDIDPMNKDQVNAMAEKGHKYNPLRNKSKNPTFALTYQGTFGTLMRNYGFSETLAKQCEAAYKSLYKVSVDWVNAKLDQAMVDGYITAAFGLRVRTPLLKQVIRGTKKTPREAEAEGRSAGNALGQSWCLLNSRAGSEFMGKVRKSQYRLDIRPCAQIHDAQYVLIRDDIEVIMYANEHIVKAVQWQDHPDIWHDEVKLEGEFGIFYPDWSTEMTLPNGATVEQIQQVVAEHLKKLEEAK